MNIEEIIALEQNMATAIDATGKEVDTLAGDKIHIEYHRFQIVATGQSYHIEAKSITPPKGWRRVAVSVANWGLNYGHDRYENAQVAHASAGAGVNVSGNTVDISAYALLREAVSAPSRKWRASITVQVIFSS